MKKLLVLALMAMTFTVGCTDRDDQIGVNIRIKNTNAYTYDSVQVGDEDKIHSDVEAGAYSLYLPYETAYTYAYIEIDANGETYVLQPIDFVGETPLNIGFYTYELSVDNEGNVSLNFVED